MGEHSPFTANGKLNGKAAELAEDGLFRKYKKGGTTSSDEYGGLAFRKVLAHIILKKTVPSKANTKGMVLPAKLVAYAECAVEYMLKGKDLPRDESFETEYKEAVKAVRQRDSSYVTFEGAAAAAEADD
ncbi:chchd6 [Chlorella sorokiniana]|uniref:Chchd6 n=1 Tax=Chlorella sorokiniana TaxID=3076 RepID=A0A2P6TFR2_CHLSO|nr:chchd6 [Chlorella sorokiniana]|eukprot:PRW32958.1 chchd6 [Chlorella sorokiniana]